jgi:branched-chain amino acid transport system permease protein
MTLLGGIGTLSGPPIGTAITVYLQTNLAAIDFPVTVLIGLIFVVCVMLFRRGIAGEVIEWLRRRRAGAS